MAHLQPSTARLPPALRALALGLLVETAVPLPRSWPGAGMMLPGPGGGATADKADLWRALRRKCGELRALVLQADDPAEAAAYVLDHLPNQLEDVFERATAAPEDRGQGPEVRTAGPLTSCFRPLPSR